MRITIAQLLGEKGQLAPRGDSAAEYDCSHRQVPTHLSQAVQPVTTLFLFMLFPTLALAQSGSPFDTGFTALQALFTGTIGKVASLIAIVIGGYQFAHGEPGAKKTTRE
jgi:type IV secretory pathway VirB2 component (pilin)